MVSIWNSRKTNKGDTAGFLGCVRLMPQDIQKLKDSGCMFCVLAWHVAVVYWTYIRTYMHVCMYMCAYVVHCVLYRSAFRPD